MEKDKMTNSANTEHVTVTLLGTRDRAVTKTDKHTCPQQGYVPLRKKQTIPMWTSKRALHARAVRNVSGQVM